MEKPGTRWWASHDACINGVFKGGGAKGVLYGGALQAIEAEGKWFRAVAGSSAGAITATLVAAGVSPTEIGQIAATGLGKIEKNWLFDLTGSPFIRTKRLKDWLSELLADQIVQLTGEARPASPVTFRELYDASGIELNVVCVNVAARQPAVFNHAITPELTVVDAVLASSSIPFAFRPGRLRVAVGDDCQVHRLMDGGVWANYPAFVFKDRSFRAYHSLPDVPTDAVTIGFTLDTEDADGRRPPTAERFETGTTASHGDAGAGLRGWMRNPALRIFFLTIVPLVVVAEFAWTSSEYGLLVLKDNVRGSGAPGWIEGAAGFFDGFFTNFWPARWLILAALLIFAAAMLLIGATVIDSGLPALRTLMAVGTDVPYWVGAAPEDHVIRLQVPAELNTLSFDLTESEVEEYVAEARISAAAQLATILQQ